ncbi:MAG: leucyl/phenylalanyl-tRNA--protein transferase [Deltaproteobacteria bacterium]|nr:leucyl/phenylalanyl-tRNA--protein transferase [Deltaproteobacteria bacterium]
MNMPPTPWPPIEPPKTRARIPDATELGEEWVAFVTRSLDPSLVLQAYRVGIFPWPSRPGKVPWASPDPRATFPLHKAEAWPRTVKRAMKDGEAQGWTVTFDEDFEGVMRACGTRPGHGTWITLDLFTTYLQLHQMGWGHSIEVWRPVTPDEAENNLERARGKRLVGGLYGLAVGALFAGESMFHAETGGSKIAFARMAERLRAQGFDLFDVQVMTDHLALLGCEPMPRRDYIAKVKKAVARQVQF